MFGVLHVDLLQGSRVFIATGSHGDAIGSHGDATGLDRLLGATGLVR